MSRPSTRRMGDLDLDEPVVGIDIGKVEVGDGEAVGGVLVRCHRIVRGGRRVVHRGDVYRDDGGVKAVIAVAERIRV